MFKNPEECERREFVNTNPRYRGFCQTYFTAGDEEQFEETRDRISLKHQSSPPLDLQVLHSSIWEGYSGAEAEHVLSTFRYVFNKFKKGVFISIKDNKVQTFLPFSKAKFINEWSDQIKIDPRFSDLNDFFKYVSSLEDRPFSENKINRITSRWYGNNCLVRYEFPQSENDTGVHHMKSMFDELCESRHVPDVEFFVNRRDFPLLKRDGTEPYEDMWDSKTKPLLSHKYDKYIPILSSTTTSLHADIAIPTLEDWARVKFSEGWYFPKTHKRDYTDVFDTPWNSKKPIAVFRGASTGKGTTIETNPRLKVAYLSSLGKIDQDDGLPFLNAGITDWNLRPRKILGETYLRTIEIDKIPVKLVEKMTPTEQSQYKYIVHIDGHSSAFRLSLEMSMRSVILKTASEYRLWFAHLLQPYVHYIPIKDDLSDVYDKIKWCKQNDDKCQEIAKNAYRFYLEMLDKKGIFNYIQGLLYDIRSVIDYEYPPNHVDARIEEYSKTISRLPNFDFAGLNVVATTKLSAIYKTGNVVVKHTTDKKKTKENIHEAYVGTRCINYIARHSPQFTKVLGLTHTNDVVSEYIDDSVTFMDWLGGSQFDFDKYISILYQLCMGLHVAQKMYRFVHYDLFPWNILIKKGTGLYECAVEPGFVVRIQSSLVPVVIDYGKSHVVINNVHHGFVNNERFSFVYDILCLLLSSLNVVIRSKKIRRERDADMLTLLNFISGTKFCPKQLTTFQQARQFVFDNSSFSSLVSMELHELETRSPMDFCKYLCDNFNCKWFMNESPHRTLFPKKQKLDKNKLLKKINKISTSDKLLVYYFFQLLELYVFPQDIPFVKTLFLKKISSCDFSFDTIEKNEYMAVLVTTYKGEFEISTTDLLTLAKK